MSSYEFPILNILLNIGEGARNGVGEDKSGCGKVRWLSARAGNPNRNPLPSPPLLAVTALFDTIKEKRPAGQCKPYRREHTSLSCTMKTKGWAHLTGMGPGRGCWAPNPPDRDLE